MKEINEKPTNWLSDYEEDITSSSGEDGIIKKIFEIIKSENPWFVEFGASDGYTNSNTWNLSMNKGWSGILIEADASRFFKLSKRFNENKNVQCLKRIVNFEGEDKLDNILSSTSIPKHFDLLSIDIDGNDYHIWESTQLYQPKVVIIEFNPSIPIDIEFVQARNISVSQGSSIKSITQLGKEKGYELISVTRINAIFVQQKYFKLFDIKDNSLHLFRKNRRMETQIYYLYDGTIKLAGWKKLHWINVDIDENKIQMIPKFLRHYPSSKLSIIHRFLLIFYQKGMKGYIEMPILIMQKIIKKISNKN